ncbi:histone deacetylase family protein [Jannaschia sp. LMIT008]|uniref:histone deacetylase family protein n=1 Tax=Jannaschia maritima TaxID=3032585 RepID=UPI002811BDD2|nr:histone deacetylase family protein [Jannaschia sp. LMIT008]
MRTYHSEDHRLHFPQAELAGGQLVTPFERPSRVEYVLRRLRERGFEAPADPGPCDLDAVARVHAPDYLDFLERAWDDWVADGNAGEIIATNVPAPGMSAARRPEGIEGQVGWYAHASETAMTAGTWAAAKASAACAQAATRDVMEGARHAFALCRPPGHHATRAQFGGYCFLNNAAVAARMLRDGGAGRVAVLDVDFHHGNGTQGIFWEDGTVHLVSIHGDPLHAYPHYIGYADETGAGDGAGATTNLPLPPGTPYRDWADALDRGIGAIRDRGAEALVVSLGTDAYRDDPISFFKLDSDDFRDMGARVAALDLPAVVCFEGGYAIEAVGVNAVNFLEGLAGR